MADNEYRQIQDEYNKAISYQHADPVVSLWRARKTAEVICRQLYEKKIGSYPKRLEFGKAINRLEEQKILPEHIAVPLRTTQHYGNLGTHSQKDAADYITPEYVQACLDSLTTVVTWYRQSYYPDEPQALVTPENTVYVFISYCHQEPNNTLAHDFDKVLRQAGHTAFIDTGIRWGTDWAREIRYALGKAEYLLLLLSKETVNSEMVMEEVAIARELASQQNGIPIILPVRVRFPFSEALPYQLELHLNTIQQETWNGPQDTPRLVASLLSTIREHERWSKHPDDVSSEPGLASNQPQPHFDPRNIIHPGGAIDVHSAIYIERKEDKEAFYAVNSSRAMVTVRGPRQIGKTSLVMRIYAAMQQRARVAFVDFQALPYEQITSLNEFWRTIVLRIAKQWRLTEWNAAQWNDEIEYDENLSLFFEDVLAEQPEQPLLICFDEVDRVFRTSMKSGFFASIRSFYNSGALDPLWRKVRWLLVTSSEPRFFIEDLTQSPFNIGLQIELTPFTPDEVAVFARRHGLRLSSPELDEIMAYTGGHPYLTHLLLYHLMHDRTSHETLFNARNAGGNIFRDHLHRYLIHFQQDHCLAEAMQAAINGKGCEDAKIASRLEAAGLVRRNEQNEIVPLCRLYAEFFERELG